MRTFRKAEVSDAAAIAALINAANTGGADRSTWTHEAELFEGDRIDAAEIEELLRAPRAVFLMCVARDVIAGCAYLKAIEADAYLGLLAVRPALQGEGVGKLLLAEAERIARDEWRCASIRMTVFTAHRPELTSFYERRGYARTGQFKRPERQQEAKVTDLRLEWMTKALDSLDG